MTRFLSYAREHPQEFSRFMKFAVVGTIGAVVDFGVFRLMNVVVGLPGVVAQGISFSTAVVSNFLWNRYWTYPDSRSKPLSKQLTQFVVVSVISLVIRTPIFALLEKPLGRWLDGVSLAHRLPIPPVQLGSNLALAAAVITVLFWNFIINRVWTYNDVR